MYTLTRKLSVVCLTVVLSFLVYGCGGSSKQATITDVSTDMVTAGLTPDSGTYTIQPGGTANAGDVTFACPEEGSSCEVTVADDGTVTSAGGMAMAMTSASAAARLAAVAEAEASEAARVAAVAAAEASEAARVAAVAAAEASEAARVAAVAAANASEEDRVAAVAAAMVAEAARVAAVAEAMAAEEDRVAAVAAAEASEAARVAAVAAAEVSEAARVAAVAEAEASEAARVAAEEVARLAGTAQAAAEVERDAAEEAARLAGIAQAAAEVERDAAEEAARLAGIAQAAAEETARLAGIAKDAAEGDRDAANEAARLAGIAQEAAESDRDDANEAARLAGIAKDTAEGERDAANEAARLAGIAKDTAEGERDAAEEAAMLADTMRDEALAALVIANRRLNPNNVDLRDLLENFTTITAGIYNINPGRTQDVDDATFTCPSGGLACEIVVADDGTVTSAGGMATAQNSMAANTSKMAIALTATDGALLSTAATADDGAPTVVDGVDVKRAPNGNIMITLTPDDDEDGKYTSAAVDAGHGITGWMGRTLKRNNAIAETETDNAEPATSMHETTIYTDIVSARAAKLTFKEVPLPTNEDGFGVGVNTYELAIDPNQDATDVNDDEEFTGYYIRPGDGYKIRGTFTCRTDACATVDVPETPSTEGNLLIAEHLMGWGFESDNNVEEGYVLDEDYLYFGYWLKSPVEPSADASDYNFATYFGGNSPFAVLQALTETWKTP